MWAPGSVVVELEGVTDGAASTVLKAREFIDNQDQLMIANSDQYVNINVDTYLYKIYEEKLDGLIMTMTAHDPKWSFVSLDSDGFVNKVVEKDVISDEATVGIYNFSRGQDFVRGADMMIAANRKSNGEFYVAPVYNELVNAGSRVGIYNIGAEADGMYGLGIPEDLEFFLSHPVSAKIKELASC
ncbi:nucleotidyl transferase [Gluconacetobacter johannae DSM 13595]|nr:nucleotidyl transferase [Gluconacetobacter johannae DSM 13595]